MRTAVLLLAAAAAVVVVLMLVVLALVQVPQPKAYLEAIGAEWI
jgi:hypothetical protein